MQKMEVNNHGNPDEVKTNHPYFTPQKSLCSSALIFHFHICSTWFLSRTTQEVVLQSASISFLRHQAGIPSHLLEHVHVPVTHGEGFGAVLQAHDPPAGQ